MVLGLFLWNFDHNAPIPGLVPFLYLIGAQLDTRVN